MSNAYEYDLRRKVIDAIELDGIPRIEASRVFNVSPNTIHLWLKLKEETGDLNPKPLKHQGPHCLIKDWDKFKAFIELNADKTHAQLAQLWDDDISACTVSRALKRIGFTRKKRLTATANAMSKRERPFENNCQR